MRVIMMDFKKSFGLLLIVLFMSGCSLWPYKKDFDCPVGEGVKCKSLYEISRMADKGMFGPKAHKKSLDRIKECKDCKKHCKQSN